MKDPFSIRGIVFLAIFAILAFAGLQIGVFSIQGANGKAFTLFEFFGPMAGGFLGIGGAAVVFAAKLANALINGTSLSLIDVIKLTPMMFAAYYFWKNGARGVSDKLAIVVPILAMAAFWMHPVGQGFVYIKELGTSIPAGIYALYWTIPIIAKMLPDRLFLRSLGATFTAHAVGCILWLYFPIIPYTPEAFIALIPVTAIERTLFALGISASYIFFTNILNAVDNALELSKHINVEKKYVLQL